MKKYFILISLVLFILLLGSCKPPTHTNSKSKVNTSILDLKFLESIYSNKEIKISYPQISNLNLQLSSVINETIKNESLGLLNDYSEDIEDLSLEINYTYELLENRIISICFQGIAYTKNAAYPNNIFYTSNIDLRTGKKLVAKDILEVNRDLIEIIKKNAKYENGYENRELTSAINEEFKNYDPSNMLTDIKESGTVENKIYLYLKQNSLGVSFPVMHALGDYANFEIDYDDLSEFLKF
jgi:hypothetical protein